MIFTACKYAPVEILSGFGEETERLDPEVSTFSCAEGCSHPDLCSYAKALIEEVHDRNIQKLVLTDCCDATRRVYDVLRKHGNMKFLYLLPFPHKNGKSEVLLFSDSLRKFTRSFEQYSHHMFDPEKALIAYRKQYENRTITPDKKYIRVIGAHGERHLMDTVRQEFGEMPVVNDTCTGNRHLSHPINQQEDFFLWYADALLNQENPCMRMWYNGGINREGNQPAGVIFHTIKFCDYYSFEYMEEKNTRIPLMKIETDTTPESDGQLKTRLSAFREELGIEKNMKISEKKNRPVYVAGLDSGSASTDAVIMDENRKILARAIIPTGGGAEKGADTVMNQVLKQAGLRKEDLSAIITTGYGRDSIDNATSAVTEITCHAKGANYLDPLARTVIDIGGQDSKVIEIDEKGNVRNFIMNDKCAAGTGRFLETQARAMNLSMEEMSDLGTKWKNPVTISSMCTVFAESEVVSLIANNTPVQDIIHGLNESVARKTASLLQRLGGKGPFIMTGGVSHNRGVVDCLQEVLKDRIVIPEDAQLAGAIGACLIALDQIQNNKERT